MEMVLFVILHPLKLKKFFFFISNPNNTKYVLKLNNKVKTVFRIRLQIQYILSLVMTTFTKHIIYIIIVVDIAQFWIKNNLTHLRLFQFLNKPEKWSYKMNARNGSINVTQRTTTTHLYLKFCYCFILSIYIWQR